MMAWRGEYTDEQQQWRRCQGEEDRQRREFYDQINLFPNLQTLRPQFQNKRRAKELLERQQFELEQDGFQYHLEKVRCQNLIVFLLALLDRRKEALEFCKKLLPENEKSITTLCNLAVLQWEHGQKNESRDTVLKLQDFYKLPEYQYLLTVAKSEKGHALLCYGPRYFLQAMELYDEAIKETEGSNVFLWKYDLALAIRRNFNIFVYSEHRLLTASVLAKRAAELFQDVSSNCLNEIYKARSQIEFASLLSHLKSFIHCCKEEDRDEIAKFCMQDHMPHVQQALKLLNGKDDFYVFRLCGRLYKYAGDDETAILYLEKARSLRDEGIVNQLLAKTYLSCSYKKKTGGFHCDEDLIPEKEDDTEDGRTTKRSLSCPPENLTHMSLGHSNEPAIGEADFMVEARQLGQEECASSEALRLHAEFDQSAAMYLNDDGTFKSSAGDVGSLLKVAGQSPYTQQMEVWNFTIIQSKLAIYNCAIIIQKGKKAQLLKEYDDSVLINKDGTFKTQETECVGNIRQHKNLDQFASKPPFQVSYSFPSDNTSRKRKDGPPGFHETSKVSARRCLLKCSFTNLQRYDESDPLVKKAEIFFKRALEVDPSNKALIYDVGRMYQGMNKPQKALEFFQQIVCGDLDSSPLELVNAYEQSGLCLLQLSARQSGQDHKHHVSRAEDMFMNSLRECRRAVAHMPRISKDRATLWKSYSEMLSILQGSCGEMQVLQKRAKVHELVGKYLEAIEVYQDVLDLAPNVEYRKEAILGLVKNNFDMGNFKDARFILDLLLSCEDRKVIINDTDGAACELRHIAFEVFTRAAADSLQAGSVRDARLCFHSALLLYGGVQERADDDDMPHTGGADLTIGTFDGCIFDDEDGVADGVAQSSVSSSLMKIMQDIFGMRVSLNDSGVAANHLGFLGELQLARAVRTVVLVLTPGRDFSPRMAYLVDAAMRSENIRCLLPVILGEPSSVLPCELDHMQHRFYGAQVLAGFSGDDKDMTSLVIQNHSVISHLFQFIVNPPPRGHA